MCITNRVYIIICEGDSEYAYIQELNRYLRNNGYHFHFIAKKAGNGHFTTIKKKYETERKLLHKKHPKDEDILIWVDKDTYCRDDNGDRTKYDRKSKRIPDFLFSIMNFEDFLALHMDDNTLENWNQICSSNRHHVYPLKEEEYLPLVRQYLFKQYTKGEIPFEITAERLDMLFKHNTSGAYPFKCAFADFLKKKIDKDHNDGS